MKKKIFSFCLLFISICVFSQDKVFNEANSLLLNDEFDQALKMYQSIMNNQTLDNTQKTWCHAYMATCYEGLNDIDKAIVEYECAVKGHIEDQMFYDRLIELSKKQKKWDVLRNAYEIKKVKFPKQTPAINIQISALLSKMKSYKENLKFLQNHSFDDSIKYCYYLGESYIKLKQFQEAEKVLLKGYSMKNDHVNINQLLAMFYFKMGNSIIDKEKKKYESIAKPTRNDYAIYRNKSQKGKDILIKSEKYLLFLHSQKPNQQLSQMLNILYTRIGQKEKAQKYVHSK